MILRARAAHIRESIRARRSRAPRSSSHVRLLWECGEFVQGRLEDLFPLIGPRLALAANSTCRLWGSGEWKSLRISDSPPAGRPRTHTQAEIANVQPERVLAAPQHTRAGCTYSIGLTAFRDARTASFYFVVDLTETQMRCGVSTCLSWCRAWVCAGS